MKIPLRTHSGNFNYILSYQLGDIPRRPNMEDAMRTNHFVKLAGAILLTTGLAGTASANNYGSAYDGQTPHEACKSDENRGKLIGGGIGAVAGAVLGSQVAGNGARTEASVIGGVLGGLAGAGIADKRVDCDPVYRNEGYSSSGYHTSSGGTYTTAPRTTYGSSPSYSSTHSTGYSQAQYGTRTTVSDHPVYSDPTWGAQPARTYVSQPVSQPVYTQPSYSQPTYQAASYSQPRVVNSTTTRYVSAAPTTTYVRPATTTYVQPTTYVRPRATRSYRHRSHGAHYHGRYSCDDRH